VSIEDVLGAMLVLLTRDHLRGPVNVTAPDPPTNAAFTRALGAALRRPTWLPVPAPLLRWQLD
jgi:NAD dependent epimerase/dehydratase family enzyme